MANIAPLSLTETHIKGYSLVPDKIFIVRKNKLKLYPILCLLKEDKEENIEKGMSQLVLC
jgi:hypothetical protein